MLPAWAGVGAAAGRVRRWFAHKAWQASPPFHSIRLPLCRKLSELINESHVNAKYLPGVDLGDNVLAVPDLVEAARCVLWQFASLLLVCLLGDHRAGGDPT